MDDVAAAQMQRGHRPGKPMPVGGGDDCSHGFGKAKRAKRPMPRSGRPVGRQHRPEPALPERFQDAEIIADPSLETVPTGIGCQAGPRESRTVEDTVPGSVDLLAQPVSFDKAGGKNLVDGIDNVELHVVEAAPGEAETAPQFVGETFCIDHGEQAPSKAVCPGRRQCHRGEIAQAASTFGR
ncbi:hypothetical protein [Mesorhizobium qingshengii]|uniref:hypothetical protein n=1 Tax=Mesorhizobium qingshengii TaxID=1165689 RepID=UPI00115FF808|nr:hypothetical protein [Mesorhizobium qingshengii]